MYTELASGAVDARVWRTVDYGDGVFRLEALNDAITVVQATYLFNRNGDLQATRFVGDGSATYRDHSCRDHRDAERCVPAGLVPRGVGRHVSAVGAAFSTAGAESDYPYARRRHVSRFRPYPSRGELRRGVPQPRGSVSGTTGSVGITLTGGALTGIPGRVRGHHERGRGSSGNMTRGPHYPYDQYRGDHGRGRWA